MTDEEVICGWMEPKPEFRPPFQTDWWMRAWSEPKMVPIKLTFDALWEVQDMLTDEQWDRYEEAITGMAIYRQAVGYVYTRVPTGWTRTRFLLHATAEQKIKALAAVIRGQLAKGKQ